MEYESNDSFIGLIEELIEKIRKEDDYASFMVGSMAAIVEYSQDAIIGIDNDGTIMSWNKGAERMYGYGTEEAIGKPVSILIPHDNDDELKCLLGKISKNKLICNFETIREKKNGERINVSVTVSPIKTSEDVIVGASTIERDITHQKRVEEALKKSEEKYRRLFNDDLTGDFIATVDGRILECNPSFVEIYGFKTVEEAKKSSISKFNPDEWEKLIQRLTTDKKVKWYRTTHQRPDGRKINIIANLVALEDDTGKFNQVKGYIFENEEHP